MLLVLAGFDDATQMLGHGIKQVAFLAQKRTFVALRALLQIADLNPSHDFAVGLDGAALAADGPPNVARSMDAPADGHPGASDLGVLPGLDRNATSAGQDIVQRHFLALGQAGDLIQAIQFLDPFAQGGQGPGMRIRYFRTARVGRAGCRGERLIRHACCSVIYGHHSGTDRPCQPGRRAP